MTSKGEKSAEHRNYIPAEAQEVGRIGLLERERGLVEGVPTTQMGAAPQADVDQLMRLSPNYDGLELPGNAVNHLALPN